MDEITIFPKLVDRLHLEELNMILEKSWEGEDE